jgi:hypothetical protein
VTDTYLLTPTDRVRPYAIGAVLDLLGAVALVLGLQWSATILIVIGVLALLIGTGISVAAVVVRQKLRTVVVLDDDGLTIRSGGEQARARWADISGATTDQRAIYLERSGDLPSLKISSPRGAQDPRLIALAAELTSRLDQSRGYHPL